MSVPAGSWPIFSAMCAKASFTCRKRWVSGSTNAMPIGIALVDPETHRFLHVNDAFAHMALKIGQLPAGTDIGAATYGQIKDRKSVVQGQRIDRGGARGARCIQ